MTEQIKQGKTRGQFSTVYHELWDLYHPYIGDTATMFYLYLYRYRNNQNGKSWKGRTSILEKFRISSKTLPKLDKILESFQLIEIETIPSGRGKDKIVYVLNDPLERDEFRKNEEQLRKRLQLQVDDDSSLLKMIGKESVLLFPTKSGKCS